MIDKSGDGRSFHIREEIPADVDAIHALTAEAFAPMSYSDGSEPGIVRALRADGDLSLSLVAEANGKIIGHVAFSEVKLTTPGDWVGLGPISVSPNEQKRGVGSAMIHAGLDHFRNSGAAGCVLVGDPGYYSRFGFAADGAVSYMGLESRYVQWLAFSATTPSGEIQYAPAFTP